MLILQRDIYALWLSALSLLSGSVCFRFCSDGESLQRAHLTAETVWQTGSLWVGQVWGEYCETVGWKAALLPWLLTSSILLKFSPEENKERGTTPRVLVTEKVCCQLSPPLYPVVPDTARNVHIIAEFHVQTRVWRMTGRAPSHVKQFCGEFKVTDIVTRTATWQMRSVAS